MNQYFLKERKGTIDDNGSDYGQLKLKCYSETQDSVWLIYSKIKTGQTSFESGNNDQNLLRS